MSLKSTLLEGEVKLPGIGPVKKQVLVPIAAGAAGFIAWRYYRASSVGTGDAAADDPAADDDGFGADAGAIPDVLGSVPSNNGYGYTSPADDDTTSPGIISTNAEWTTYAAEQLSASDTWTYTDIVSALGAYLNRKPLTSLQVSIVQAAIAVAGNPPVGSYTLVSGGDTSMVVTPQAPSVTNITATSAVLSTSAVAGASSYAWTVDGVLHGSSTSPTGHVVQGLAPNAQHVAAVDVHSASGQVSPYSAGTTFRTLAGSGSGSGSTGSTGGTSGGTGGSTGGTTQPSGGTKPPATKPPAKPAAPKIPPTPTTPKVSSIGATGGHASVKAVAGATGGYTWFINGASAGHTSGTSHTMSALHPGRQYSLTVEALDKAGNRSHQSAPAHFTTKKA